MTKLDEFLPVYEYNEIHEITIRSSLNEAYTALKSVRISDISVFVSWLLTLRALPARLIGNDHQRLTNTVPLLEAMSRNGFVSLAEVPESEIVIGMIGQPWKIMGGDKPAIHGPDEFLNFGKPDYALIATNLRVVAEIVHGCITCTTETRVHIPDLQARRQFSNYWRITSIGSGLIRQMWLNAIKERAEK